MPEERTCELCEYGRNLPCKNKGCNSANNLKDFKPKGEDKENPGWSIGDFTYIKKGDILSVHLLNKSGGMIIVELSPNQIADISNNYL